MKKIKKIIGYGIIASIFIGIFILGIYLIGTLAITLVYAGTLFLIMILFAASEMIDS